MSEPSRDSVGWVVQTWASFVIALAMSVGGIASLPLDGWTRGFVVLAYLFSISTCFSLAKTLRDRHESQRLVSRLDDARTQELLERYAKGQL